MNLFIPFSTFFSLIPGCVAQFGATASAENAPQVHAQRDSEPISSSLLTQGFGLLHQGPVVLLADAPKQAGLASSVPTQATHAFEKLLHKAHQEMRGVALSEVAPSRRLHERPGQEGLAPWQQKAATLVTALVQFRNDVSEVGGSTVLVLVIVLGIPVLIVFCSAFFFLNERSKENPQPPPRVFSMQPTTQSPMLSSMSVGSGASRPQMLSIQRASIGSSRLSNASPSSTLNVLPTPKPSIGGSMGFFRGSDSDVLCPALIVQQTEGVTLLINGAILPYQQEEVLEVNKIDHEKGVIVRVFISESGRDSGILLESVLRFPIAFINTSNAVNAKGMRSPVENRHVSISRASPIGGGEPSASTFAVVHREPSGKFIVRRGASASGPVLQYVTLSGRAGSVQDASGRQMASVESPHGPGVSLTIHVVAGVDAGMCLCSVIAAAKLL